MEEYFQPTFIILILEKAQKNEINFLWILDGKGLKGCKELLKDTYLKNKYFIFTLASFEK